MNAQQRIGLALSGGGVRAMAFHCGVLRWLAETQRIERVVHVSSVSGGSLLTGLVFKLSGWRWPTAKEYLETVMPAARHLLTNSSLQWAAIRRLLLPWNWRFILSRANVISQVIERQWGVDARLEQLAQAPDWSVNATTAETGKRFRFKQRGCGDYEIGYAPAAQFKVADAMAVSAAFPGGIGPLVIRPQAYTWKKRPTWDGPAQSLSTVELPYKRLHLYDGGVYDNLGMEPLFDVGRKKYKADIDYLVVSDAGAPFERRSPNTILNPFRLKRIMDITMEQVRALRLRAFMPFLLEQPGRGAYVQIGVEAQTGIQKLLKEIPGQRSSAAAELLKKQWMSDSEVSLAAQEPTSLAQLSPKAFDRLEAHGYESAKWSALLLQP